MWAQLSTYRDIIEKTVNTKTSQVKETFLIIYSKLRLKPGNKY